MLLDYIKAHQLDRIWDKTELRLRLNQAGMTHTDAASICGVDRRTIARYLSGDTVMSGFCQAILSYYLESHVRVDPVVLAASRNALAQFAEERNFVVRRAHRTHQCGHCPKLIERGEHYVDGYRIGANNRDRYCPECVLK